MGMAAFASFVWALSLSLPLPHSHTHTHTHFFIGIECVELSCSTFTSFLLVGSHLSTVPCPGQGRSTYAASQNSKIFPIFTPLFVKTEKIYVYMFI